MKYSMETCHVLSSRWFLNKRTHFLLLYSHSFIHHLPFWGYSHVPLLRQSQGLKWDKCVEKHFTARGCSSPVPWRCALLLWRISISDAWTHTKTNLWRCALWKAVPAMWVAVGKTNLHTFPPVGFWNTVTIIKDLTYWLPVTKLEKQIST